MPASREEFNSEKNHFIRIFEESFLLYKKRQQEIKRAVKAAHRAAILPSPRVIYNLLEALIGYAVSSACLQTLKETYFSTREAFEEELKRITTPINQEQPFEESDDFFKKFKCYLKKGEYFSELCLSEKHFQLLLSYAFQRDEEKRRETTKVFLKDFALQLIQLIFKKLAILDKGFAAEVIAAYENAIQIN